FLKANRLDIEERDEKLARLLLDDVEEGIQAIGLKMIGLFPLSLENLQIIAARLSLTMDDELFRDGIEFLYQHKSNPEVVKEAEKIFLRQIRYGPSDETAARAAIAAFDFMNEQNVRSFERLRAEM